MDEGLKKKLLKTNTTAEFRKIAEGLSAKKYG